MPNTLPGTPASLSIAKAQARRLATALAGQLDIKHGQALELVARLHGQESFGHLRSVIEAGRERPLPAAPTPASSIEPREGDDRVLLERISLDGALHLIDRHRQVREGGGLDMRLRAEIVQLLGDIADQGQKTPGVYTGAAGSRDGSAYLERVTLGAIRAAEAQALAAGTIQPWKYGFPLSVLLANILPEDPGALPTPRGRHAISPAQVEVRFNGLTPYRLGADAIPREMVFDGRHSLVLGSDLSVLKATTPQIVDLTSRKACELGKIAEAWGLVMPSPGFASGTVGLIWLIGQRMAQYNAGDAEMKHGVRPGRQIIALSLSDMAASGRSDVLMAQARALGLHVLVVIDREDVDARDFEKVADTAAGLIDLRGAPVAVVRSARLHETRGGRLKVARPFERLSLSDKIRNGVVRLQT